ncbi:MAG: hypothetical protein N2255_10165, partial [Kiritimatiellae bacterium]|nr:hypothetical protein [Kiritimatiellia bacterium]
MRYFISLLLLPTCLLAQVRTVTGIRALHKHGQTFVMWTDLAEGEEGAKYRYSVYRAEWPITAEKLNLATLCVSGVLNNSAKLFGSAFNQKDRQDPSKPTCIIQEGGEPLPNGSGLAVITVTKPGKSFYAVVATESGKIITAVVPGQSATTAAVEEVVGPIQPIKLYDSNQRGRYSQQTRITGEKGLPLSVSLHASSGQGGGASAWGDYYLYFSRSEWGYQDGLPGVFSVEERQKVLILNSRDAIVMPDGSRALETYWFGYACVPAWANHKEPRAYNFTERRMLWIIDWVIHNYGADPERVTCSGGSMGAWGTMTFAFRHPEIFAAVYPNRPRMIQKGLPSLVPLKKGERIMLDDGTTDYFERMDMVRFAREHHEDLPFVGWCCGRRDGFATFQEQVEMVRALTESHHGFAFAWNNGDHSSGSEPMRLIMKYYPPSLFARNKSYPAFGRSSLDNNMGNGDPTDGEMEGGINLGFAWENVVDEPEQWSVTISNELARQEATVDVTPRRCQKFKPKPDEPLEWSDSHGTKGMVHA